MLTFIISERVHHVYTTDYTIQTIINFVFVFVVSPWCAEVSLPGVVHRVVISITLVLGIFECNVPLSRSRGERDRESCIMYCMILESLG